MSGTWSSFRYRPIGRFYGISHTFSCISRNVHYNPPRHVRPWESVWHRTVGNDPNHFQARRAAVCSSAFFRGASKGLGMVPKLFRTGVGRGSRRAWLPTKLLAVARAAGPHGSAWRGLQKSKFAVFRIARWKPFFAQGLIYF